MSKNVKIEKNALKITESINSTNNIMDNNFKTHRKGKEKNQHKNKGDFKYSQKRVRQAEKLLEKQKKNTKEENVAKS